MADRPPLLDIDYTAAVEAAAAVLNNFWGLEDAAAALVEAVWPILHAAAYGDGRASVLDGAVEEWGVRWPGWHDTDPAASRAAAQEYADRDGCTVRRRLATRWENADG